MNRKRLSIVFEVIITGVMLAGCGRVAPIAPTAMPPAPAATSRPTATATPAATPDLDATREADRQATQGAGQTQTAIYQATSSVRQTEVSQARATSLPLTPTRTPTPLLQLLSYSNDGSKVYLYNLNKKEGQDVSFAKDYIYCLNVSPDGSKILYVPSYPLYPLNDFVNLIDFEAGQIRRTPFQVIGGCDYLYWHPSGKAILGLNFETGKMELLHLTDWGIIATIDDFKRTSNPAFSPDGKKLAFFANQELRIYEIILDAKSQPIGVSQDFTKSVLPLGNSYPRQVQWSPSGLNLAFFIQRPWGVGPNPVELYIVNLDDNSLVKVADSEKLQPGIITKIYSEKEFAWSPDGTKIAFTAYTFVSVDRNQAYTTRPQIFVANTDGTRIVKITEEDQVGEEFIWSPYGDKLIYVAGVMVQESVWEYNKVVMSNPDGSGKTILMSQYLHMPFFPPQPGIDLTKIFTTPIIINCASGWTRLEVGKYAVVAPGSPNRVRTKPERGDNLIVMIPNGTVVKILDGPVCVDDLVFWKVESQSIPGGVGWTAEGDWQEYYLEPIQ